MNEESISMEDFFSELPGDGYQTAEPEVMEEPTQEPLEASETGEGEEGVNTEENEESGAEANQEPQNQPSDQTFTLKVNKQERTVNREEVIALAQKGADYDRVKAQADQGKTDNEALRAQLAEARLVTELLEKVANESGVSVSDLLNGIRVSQLRATQGLTEREAKERIARLDAEEKLAKLNSQPKKEKAEPSMEDRAKADLTEFREFYPEIPITKELLDKLMPDITAGRTMIQAYQRMTIAEKDAEIARLKEEAEAERKNKANRVASPGSVSNAGSRKHKGEFDDFFSAFPLRK